jgi:hypothetical protein
MEPAAGKKNQEGEEGKEGKEESEKALSAIASVGQRFCATTAPRTRGKPIMFPLTTVSALYYNDHIIT